VGGGAQPALDAQRRWFDITPAHSGWAPGLISHPLVIRTRSITLPE
jgi:hypothetical protein